MTPRVRVGGEFGSLLAGGASNFQRRTVGFNQRAKNGYGVYIPRSMIKNIRTGTLLDVLRLAPGVARELTRTMSDWEPIPGLHP